MKKILIVLFCIALVVPALAEQTQVLLKGEIENGGYGGPLFKTCSIKGTGGLMMGGEGAWIVNRTFFLGGKGYALISNLAASNFNPSSTGKLTLGVGGLNLGFIANSDNLTHLVISTLIGFGSVGYENTNQSNITVIEPQIDLEMNITRFFRLALGASYRLTNGVSNTPGLSDSDLSGFGLCFTFKFGSFGDIVKDIKETMPHEIREKMERE